MIFFVKYGDTTPFGWWISPNLENDSDDFMALLSACNYNRYEFISLCKEGIFIKKIEDMHVVKRIEDTYDVENIEQIKRTIAFLHGKIDTLESNLQISKKESENDKDKEVTNEFFLFYNMLPEHIKRELKIYIKNFDK